MNFVEAADGPIVLDTGKRKIALPRFGLKDIVEWAAEIDGVKQQKFDRDIQDAATDAKERFHMRTSYRIFPTDITEVLSLVKTPAGAMRVCKTCLARGKTVERDGQPVSEPLTEQEQGELIDANADQLADLAGVLAGPRQNPKPPEDKKEGKENPLQTGGQSA